MLRRAGQQDRMSLADESRDKVAASISNKHTAELCLVEQADSEAAEQVSWSGISCGAG